MRAGEQPLLRAGSECFLRTGNRVLVVEILGVSKETIWVSFPCREELEDGAGVELEFHDREGYFSYHARVVQGAGKTGAGVMLERAESPLPMQHRRDWRVPMDLSVWVKPVEGERRSKARLCDLSSEGALIECDAAFNAGDYLNMIFQLPQYPTHRIVARIVYADTSGPAMRRYGLSFVQIGRRARESLTWYLYSQIQELYPALIRELYPRASRRRSAGKPPARQPA